MSSFKKFVVPSLQEMECINNENPPENFLKKFNASSGIKSTEQTDSFSKTLSSVQKSIQKSASNETIPLCSEAPGFVSTFQKYESDATRESNLTHRETLQSEQKAAESTGANISAKPSFSNSLIVNSRQRGNPILKSVRNIPWEFGNIIPDYVMGQSNCALFLSLRYHQLHPNYIHERLKQLGKSYELRVLLVQVDVKESHHLLKDLAKICLLADCTLVLAFSPEEAGRYLETYKIFENKPPEAIMEKTEDNFIAKNAPEHLTLCSLSSLITAGSLILKREQTMIPEGRYNKMLNKGVLYSELTDCLTRVKSVNKTDCLTLISHFGTLADVMDASEEDLSLCPGFGPQKKQAITEIKLHSFKQLYSK